MRYKVARIMRERSHRREGGREGGEGGGKECWEEKVVKDYETIKKTGVRRNGTDWNITHSGL